MFGLRIFEDMVLSLLDCIVLLSVMTTVFYMRLLILHLNALQSAMISACIGIEPFLSEWQAKIHGLSLLDANCP